eukprot:UN33214
MVKTSTSPEQEGASNDPGITNAGGEGEGGPNIQQLDEEEDDLCKDVYDFVTLFIKRVTHGGTFLSSFTSAKNDVNNQVVSKIILHQAADQQKIYDLIPLPKGMRSSDFANSFTKQNSNSSEGKPSNSAGAGLEGETKKDPLGGKHLENFLTPEDNFQKNTSEGVEKNSEKRIAPGFAVGKNQDNQQTTRVVSNIPETKI